MKKLITIFFIIIFVTKFYASGIEVITKDGNVKDTSIVYNNGTLTLNNIISPIISIKFNNETEINKVIFNFVNFTEVSEPFWEKLKNISELEFNYCKLENFDFLKYLKELKILLFIESNEVNDYSHIDFSKNKKLEEIILSNYNVKDFNIISKYVPNLTYFHIAYANLDSISYSNLKSKILPKTIFVINNKQEQYFEGYNYILNTEFDYWNRSTKPTKSK